MFDRTVIQKATESRLVPYEKTVHEHRAPTDDSIRIYEETLQKAEDRLLSVVTLGDNKLKGSIAVFEDMLNLGTHVNYRFTLNGEEFTGSKKLKDSAGWDMSTTVHMLIEEIAHGIAETLVIEGAEELYRAIRR